MWTDTHFPAAMRSLNSRTRAKAIEIANQLMAQGHTDKAAIVAQSVADARQWSLCNRTSQKPGDAGNVRPYIQ